MIKAWGWVSAFVILAVVVLAVVFLRSDQSALRLASLVRNEPLAVEVSFEGGSALAGQTQHAHVRALREGQPFDVYNGGYALHLIVANPDFSNFLHTVDLHEDEPGVYGADVTFWSSGKYRVWVEVNDARGEQHHGEGAPFIGYADFRVRGAEIGVPQPRVVGKEAQAGPYTVVLDYGALRAGEDSEITLTVHDSEGRLRQLTQPEPNIYVMVGPKGDASFPFFRHGHSEPAVGGNTVVWREIFPEAGEYLLWTTVYLSGANANQQIEAVEVPFVLTVTE